MGLQTDRQQRRVLGLAATASSRAAGRRVVLAAGFRGVDAAGGNTLGRPAVPVDGGRLAAFLHTPISAVSIRMSTASMTVIRACIRRREIRPHLL